MSKEKIIKWVKAAGVRAVKTVVQTAVATIGTSAAQSVWAVLLPLGIRSALAVQLARYPQALRFPVCRCR